VLKSSFEFEKSRHKNQSNDIIRLNNLYKELQEKYEALQENYENLEEKYQNSAREDVIVLRKKRKHDLDNEGEIVKYFYKVFF